MKVSSKLSILALALLIPAVSVPLFVKAAEVKKVDATKASLSKNTKGIELTSSSKKTMKKKITKVPKVKK